MAWAEINFHKRGSMSFIVEIFTISEKIHFTTFGDHAVRIHMYVKPKPSKFTLPYPNKDFILVLLHEPYFKRIFPDIQNCS